MKKELELSPIKKLLHATIKLSKQDMDRRFSEAGVGITQLQYWVLIMIQAAPVTVNEIARQFGIKPPSLTPVVDSLEEADYLERKNDRSDRRKVQLVITKRAKDLLKKIPFDDSKDALNASFKKLNSLKQKQLLSLLQELIDNFPPHD